MRTHTHGCVLRITDTPGDQWNEMKGAVVYINIVDIKALRLRVHSQS